ncbi:hypothetical protein V6N13_115942 [Hibiscus sabdariffa]
MDWSDFFCRSLRTFEVAMLNDLQACVGDYGLKIEVEDRLVWKHDKAGNFSGVNDFMYQCLHGFFTAELRLGWVIGCAAV